MAHPIFRGIELLPETMPVKQLFILLHGVGANSADLVPLANKFRSEFPAAAFLLPDGTLPFDGGGPLDRDNRRQWFSISGVSEKNRPARVAEAMPALHAMVQHMQDRFQILQSDTALVGFSQGAIMAMEFSVKHDGHVGRVLAFSGRFARLPEKAPEFTTLHLLHGEDDPVIPVEHAHAAYETLMQLNGDATLDIASSVGHEIHPVLSDRANHRLQTCIPLRSWKQALNSAN
jgi:phospholipase/carboxylesterase